MFRQFLAYKHRRLRDLIRVCRIMLKKQSIMLSRVTLKIRVGILLKLMLAWRNIAQIMPD